MSGDAGKLVILELNPDRERVVLGNPSEENSIQIQGYSFEVAGERSVEIKSRILEPQERIILWTAPITTQGKPDVDEEDDSNVFFRRRKDGKVRDTPLLSADSGGTLFKIINPQNRVATSWNSVQKTTYGRVTWCEGKCLKAGAFLSYFWTGKTFSVSAANGTRGLLHYHTEKNDPNVVPTALVLHRNAAKEEPTRRKMWLQLRKPFNYLPFKNDPANHFELVGQKDKRRFMSLVFGKSTRKLHLAVTTPSETKAITALVNASDLSDPTITLLQSLTESISFVVEAKSSDMEVVSLRIILNQRHIPTPRHLATRPPADGTYVKTANTFNGKPVYNAVDAKWSLCWDNKQWVLVPTTRNLSVTPDNIFCAFNLRQSSSHDIHKLPLAILESSGNAFSTGYSVYTKSDTIMHLHNIVASTQTVLENLAHSVPDFLKFHENSTLLKDCITRYRWLDPTTGKSGFNYFHDFVCKYIDTVRFFCKRAPTLPHHIPTSRLRSSIERLVTSIQRECLTPLLDLLVALEAGDPTIQCVEVSSALKSSVNGLYFKTGKNTYKCAKNAHTLSLSGSGWEIRSEVQAELKNAHAAAVPYRCMATWRSSRKEKADFGFTCKPIFKALEDLQKQDTIKKLFHLVKSILQLGDSKQLSVHQSWLKAMDRLFEFELEKDNHTTSLSLYKEKDDILTIMLENCPDIVFESHSFYHQLGDTRIANTYLQFFLRSLKRNRWYLQIMTMLNLPMALRHCCKTSSYDSFRDLFLVLTTSLPNAFIDNIQKFVNGHDEISLSLMLIDFGTFCEVLEIAEKATESKDMLLNLLDIVETCTSTQEEIFQTHADITEKMTSSHVYNMVTYFFTKICIHLEENIFSRFSDKNKSSIQDIHASMGKTALARRESSTGTIIGQDEAQQRRHNIENSLFDCNPVSKFARIFLVKNASSLVVAFGTSVLYRLCINSYEHCDTYEKVNAIGPLIDRLPTSAPPLQTRILNLLAALMKNSVSRQKEFVKHKGLRPILRLLQKKESSSRGDEFFESIYKLITSLAELRMGAVALVEAGVVGAFLRKVTHAQPEQHSVVRHATDTLLRLAYYESLIGQLIDTGIQPTIQTISSWLKQYSGLLNRETHVTLDLEEKYAPLSGVRQLRSELEALDASKSSTDESVSHASTHGSNDNNSNSNSNTTDPASNGVVNPSTITAADTESKNREASKALRKKVSFQAGNAAKSDATSQATFATVFDATSVLQETVDRMELVEIPALFTEAANTPYEQIAAALKYLSFSIRQYTASAEGSTPYDLTHIPGELKARFPPNENTPTNSQCLKVMLSYAWINGQTDPKVQTIAQSLANIGHRTWLDTEKMGTDVLESMAYAVEKADVFVCCYSERYFKSEHCRFELEYASSLRKPIAWVVLDANFTPRGYLGLLKGKRYHYDFTPNKDSKQFMDKLEELNSKIADAIFLNKLHQYSGEKGEENEDEQAIDVPESARLEPAMCELLDNVGLSYGLMSQHELTSIDMLKKLDIATLVLMNMGMKAGHAVRLLEASKTFRPTVHAAPTAANRGRGSSFSRPPSSYDTLSFNPPVASHHQQQQPQERRMSSSNYEMTTITHAPPRQAAALEHSDQEPADAPPTRPSRLSRPSRPSAPQDQYTNEYFAHNGPEALDYDEEPLPPLPERSSVVDDLTNSDAFGF